MNNPEYVKIENKIYPINTDFRIAIECNNIAQSDNIGDTERPLAIIYKLFGSKGLNNPNDWEKLLELAMKYLCLNKELDDSDEEPDMDFNKDMDYIEASFMSDYKIDLAETKMHWWKFFNLIEGLSNSELGNCCVLNRIRNLRTFDASKIKDHKEKQKILEAKERFSLNRKKEIKMTDKERKSQDRYYNLLNEGD